MSDVFRMAATTGLTLCASAAIASAPTAASAANSPFVGSYYMTATGGGGVRETELRLMPDGEMTMTTESSALTGRPVERNAAEPILERGTWHREGKRAIVKIVSTSNVTVTDPSQKPTFTTIAFSLQGCILHLEASEGSIGGLDFTKRRCH